MGLPSTLRVGKQRVFLTAYRQEALVREVFPEWSRLDLVFGKSLDGTNTPIAISQLEAALRAKQAADRERFYREWVRFDLSDPKEIERNIWALLRDYCRHWGRAEIGTDSPEPFYVGKHIDTYPLYEVLTVHYPVFPNTLLAGLAYLLRPPQTSIRLLVGHIERITGTLDSFALLSKECAVFFGPRLVWTILEPISDQHRAELLRATSGFR